MWKENIINFQRDSIKETINEKQELILKVKIKYIRVSLINQVVGFLLGIRASIIASWIFECIKTVNTP